MRPMSDESISGRIERLVSEEHELRSREESDSAEALEEDAARLRAIEVELDVCWDLLRQRRALRALAWTPIKRPRATPTRSSDTGNRDRRRSSNRAARIRPALPSSPR